MKKAVLVLTVAVCALALTAPDSQAAQNEKKEAAEKHDGYGVVTGMLFVVRNEQGKVTGATLTTKVGKKKISIYTLVITGVTQDLIPIDGVEVEVRGSIKEVGDKTMLKVQGKIEIVIPTVTGVLAVVRDNKGKLTGATVTSRVSRKTNRVYNLIMGHLIQDLSRLDGKEVQCKGTVDVVDGNTVLKVIGRIEVIPEKPAKDAKAKDAK